MKDINFAFDESERVRILARARELLAGQVDAFLLSVKRGDDVHQVGFGTDEEIRKLAYLLGESVIENSRGGEE
ncbi:MAG: hypothetical protein ACREBC_38440 [Pyrinomonadaceae bacterium]